jgi:hypothetical protein
MSKRKQLDRERLEIYLLNLILAFSPLLRISGILLLVYGLVMITFSPEVSVAMGLLAAGMLLPGYSYTAALYWARVGAWIGTVWKQGE